MIDKNDPRLTAYLLGELDQAQMDEVQSAIENSVELREHVEGLRETIEVVQGAFGELDSGDDRLTEDQLAKLEEASRVSPVSLSESSWRTNWRRFAVAALALYAVGISFFAFQRPTLVSGVLTEPDREVVVRFDRDSPASNEVALPQPTDDQSISSEAMDDAIRARLSVSGVRESEVSLPEPQEVYPVADAAMDSVFMDTPQIQFSVEEPLLTTEAEVANRTAEILDRAAVASSGGRLNHEVEASIRAVVPAPAMLPTAPSATAEPAGAARLRADTMLRSQVEVGGVVTEEEMGMGGMMGGMGMPQSESIRSGNAPRRRMMGMDSQMAEGDMMMGMMDEMMMEAAPQDGAHPFGDGEVRGEQRGLEQRGLNNAATDSWAAQVNRRWLDGLPRPNLAAPRSPAPSSPAPEADALFLGFEGREAPSAPAVEDSLGDAMMGEPEAQAEQPIVGDFAVAPGSGLVRPEGAPAQVARESAPASSRPASSDARSLRTVPADETESEADVTIGFDAISGLPTDELESTSDVDSSNAARTQALPAKPVAKAKSIKETRPKTWKPASASTNRARLSVGHHDDLKLAARDTYVRIDGFRARVMFDLYYFNDRPQQLEGQFLLRLPDDASLHYFAFGPTNVAVPTPPATPRNGKGGGAPAEPFDVVGTMLTSLRDQTASTGSDLARRATDANYKAESNTVFAGVKTAFVTPKEKAALAYEETVRRRVDPALVEWAGPGIFQTKVFPLMPHKLHRIVVGYDVTLKEDGDDRVFTLDLPEGEAGGRVEFDIAAAAGTGATLTPETDPFVSGGRAYYRFESAAPRDYSARLSGVQSVLLKHSGAFGDQYFATRVTADLPDAAAKLDSRQAVFVLDTSWSDRPEAFSRRLQLLESILTENRESIEEFAVVTFNVHQRWWKEEFTTNDSESVADFLSYADQLVLEGATDLKAALAEAGSPGWNGDESSAKPNLFLLSDAIPTWGVTDLASLADAVRRSTDVAGGALFGYQFTGLPSDRTVMRVLADASGGAVFSVADQEDLKTAAVAHRSRPWRLAKAKASGADQVLVQSSSATIYPGQPLTIAGVGDLEGPIELLFERGSETETLVIDPKVSIVSPASARLFGQLAVERLEPFAGSMEEVAVAFARYFRVPGRTCSMVMLETEQDYQRFGVSTAPEEDQLVIASTSVDAAISRREAELALRRANPRTRFTTWVQSLESASLLNVSTALRLAMEQMPETAFQFSPRPLQCRSFLKEHMEQTYLDELALEMPEFDSLMTEADQMLIAHGADDAIKTASTIIEAKPSDVDVIRSVVFRTFEWKRGDQAAPLLWRLAMARPYQPQCLMLLGRAYADSGDLDSAIVCYDLVTSGKWNQRWAGAKPIAEAELAALLAKLDFSESSIAGYARARKRQLQKQFPEDGIDMAIFMHWNTDRTDVDLHVTEPSGEVCFYKHPKTKAGGSLTQDITEGLGPEMYTMKDAPAGEYHVEAKYFRSDQNRTKAPTEALFTVVRYLGTPNASVQTKRITLVGTQQKQSIVRLRVQE